MNINTILHIQELLKEDVRVKDEAAKLLREKVEEAENNEADNIQFLEDLRSKALHELWKAEGILNDFENAEWHC